MCPEITKRQILPDEEYSKWVVHYSSEELRDTFNTLGVKSVHHPELDNIVLSTIAPEIFPLDFVRKLNKRIGLGRPLVPAPFRPMGEGVLSSTEVFSGFCVKYTILEHHLPTFQPVTEEAFPFFLSGKFEGVSAMHLSILLRSLSTIYLPTERYHSREIPTTSERYPLDELTELILGERFKEVVGLDPSQAKALRFDRCQATIVYSVDEQGHMYFKVNNPTLEGITEAVSIFARIIDVINVAKSLLEEYGRLFLDPDSIDRLSVAKKEFHNSLTNARANDSAIAHSYIYLNSLVEIFMEKRIKEISERREKLPTELTACFDNVRDDIVNYLKRERYSLK